MIILPCVNFFNEEYELTPPCFSLTFQTSPGRLSDRSERRVCFETDRTGDEQTSSKQTNSRKSSGKKQDNTLPMQSSKREDGSRKNSALRKVADQLGPRRQIDTTRVSLVCCKNTI